MVVKTSGHEWHNYFLFKIITIAIVTIFSVLSTTTIIYTIACIYIGRDVTFNKCMQVVINIWKRLTITLLFIFLIIFTYTRSVSLAFILCNVILDVHKFRLLSILVILLLVLALYMFGFMFYCIVFHLAIAVSILETSYGKNAIFKATYLMTGKKKAALMISFVLYECLVFIVYVMYMHLSMYNDLELALVWRVVIAIVCGVLVVMIFLVIMVTQTVLYLVCKSYHHEAIEVIQFERPQNQPVFQV
ncbi:uncharacterized protein LOC143555703 [Bidens hawaiensis]|uniref:uncharacterized protein LOC143555703 n=1 Tax=Bidens hawaiensis TaxID=980011 RepID=UPI00404B334E